MTRAYHALRKDIDATRHWIDECKRLVRTESNGDRYEIGRNHFWSAFYFALVGLNDEAVDELRKSLVDYNAYRFPYVDVQPVFDGLRDHPGYIALKEELGD